MTSESLGDEFTSVMWNSAHVWQGKSSVRESTTRVRHAFCFCCSAMNVSSFFFFAIFCYCWGDESETQYNRLQWLQRYLLWQPLELMFKSVDYDKQNIATYWNVLGFFFTLNKQKDKNLATLATHIIFFIKLYNLISGLQKSIRSPPSLKKFFFTLIRWGLKDVPYPFFDHSSIVTRVTLHWRKGRLYDSLWLRNGVLGHTPWVHRILSSQWGDVHGRLADSPGIKEIQSGRYFHASSAETAFVMMIGAQLTGVAELKKKKKSHF